ncbi:MAG: EAL domain-containing protein [Gammaproteobacteria bacterium]|nr:MAG: EAL domain-containing protein [Gammaproteobacteria bacterium]
MPRWERPQQGGPQKEGPGGSTAGGAQAGPQGLGRGLARGSGPGLPLGEAAQGAPGPLEAAGLAEEPTVAQALSEGLRRVGRRQRPEGALLEGAGVFAVFEDPEAGEGFLGLATLRDVARWPERIFADLVSAGPEEALGPEAPLAEAARRLEGRGGRALPVMERGRFLGAVTRSSLLCALLAREEALRAAWAASAAYHQVLIEHSPVAVAVCEGLCLRYANQQLGRLLGREPAELRGLPLGALAAEEDRGRLLALAEGCLGTLGGGVLEFAAGREGPRLRGYFQALEHAGRTLLCATFVDVTAERRAQGELELARQVFDCADEGFMVTDAQGRILTVNRAFTAVTGYRPEEVLGRTPAVLKSGRQDAAFYQAMWRRLAEEGRWEGEIWNRRKSGEIYPEWLKITAVRDRGGAVRHYIGTFYDITAQKQAAERLRRLSSFDPLTGLPNRLLARAELGRLVREEGPPGRVHAVLFIDLDHFKELNDSLGHGVGDQVLQIVGQRLEGTVRSLARGREPDLVARLGGDEFLILLRGLRRAADARRVAEQLLERLRRPLAVGGRTLLVSASVGIALHPADAEEVEELVRKADIAMYQAKQLGRGRCAFYSQEQDERLRQRMSLRQQVRQALRRHEFLLHFQPQLRLADRAVVGVEALLRWRHPQRGLLGPGAFLDLLLEDRAVEELDRWLLDEALARLRQCREGLGLPGLRVAVNLTPHQFYEPGLPGRLERALARAGLGPEALELEITEQLALNDLEGARRQLHRLRGLGVRVALDDFGTGYSSLNHLRQLEIQALKLDRSFVRRLPEDPRQQVIVRCLAEMARHLGIEVVAEGVETPQEEAMARELGCDLAQGYLYCPPVDPEGLAAPLAALGAGPQG